MHQPVSAQRSRHIPVLDGLRGVAAIAVMLGHLHLPIAQSALAVDFFFLLSGYVMARSYEHRFEAGMTLIQFSQIRLIRLYPLILLGSLMLLVVILLGYKQIAGGNLTIMFLFGVLLIPVFTSGMDIFRINGVQWSLLFELAANAAHRLFYRWLSLSLIAMICCTSMAILIIAARTYGSFTSGWWGNNAWVGIGRVGFSYFAGVAVFRIFGDRPIFTALPAVLILMVFCVLLAMPKIPGLPVNGVWLGIVSVAFPAIIVASIGSTVSLLSARLYALLGEISYPLYATHGAVTIPARYFAEGKPPGRTIAIYAVAITCALALAILSSRLWDIPVRRWLNRGSSYG